MKKFFSLIVVLLGITTTASIAQNSFEGVIKAKLEATAVPDEMKGMEAMMSQQMTITMKGDQTKVESAGAMGTTTMLMDYKKHESVLLMDMMGSKTAVKDQLSENDTPGMQFQVEGGKFEATTQTKSIAGHQCTLYKVTTTEEGETFNVDMWIATDLHITEGDGMPGTPFEYTFSAEGITMTYQITEVSKQAIPATAFAIPEGYTVQTKEEFEKQYPMMKD